MASFEDTHINIQRQMNETQWMSSNDLRYLQMLQLRLIVEHAIKNLPFYARRFEDIGIKTAKDLDEESWDRLPVLTRKEIQENTINTESIPSSHGRIASVASSGSTSTPIRITKTDLSNLIWTASSLRNEVWNRLNPEETMVFIRHGIDDGTPEQLATLRSTGLYQNNYGPPNSIFLKTGGVWIIDTRCPVSYHADLISRTRPECITAMPSNLSLLLKYYEENNNAPNWIKSVWTVSEALGDLRERCLKTLNCKIIDSYSCAETGYIALQCPEHEHYHVQSETIRLEVLRPDNTHCKPGEIGRVVITPLHNFASPLFRYEIGDEAEVGDPCPCGRGLSVLKRIIGRTYDYLTMPDGRKQRVDTGYYPICAIPAVRELQIVQRSKELIEILLVLSRPLNVDEIKNITELCTERFGDIFEYRITKVDSISQTISGKRRIFISEVD
jgi:phenylacetate-CoA ligase